MSGGLCYVDNDILGKLVTCQLFESTVQIFNLSFEDVYILETAKYKFRKDWEKVNKGKARRLEAGLIKYPELLQLCDGLTTISESDIDIDMLVKLNDIDDIDIGEAQLTVAAMQSVKSGRPTQLITGDKRFIKALAGMESPIIQESLCGRVICFEQIILMNINTIGFEQIKAKVVPVRDCDKAIKAAFGSGRQATQDNVLEMLNCYIEDLRQESCGLLF